MGRVRDVTGPVMSEEIAKLVAKHPSAKAGRNYGLGAGIDLGDKHGNFLFNMHEPSEGLEILRSDLRDNLSFQESQTYFSLTNFKTRLAQFAQMTTLRSLHRWGFLL